MIKSNAVLSVYKDAQGIYFHSDEVDLDKVSLTIPINIGDSLGTVDFSRRSVILHPPNDEDVEYTADDFMKRWGDVFGLNKPEE